MKVMSASEASLLPTCFAEDLVVNADEKENVDKVDKRPAYYQLVLQKILL